MRRKRAAITSIHEKPPTRKQKLANIGGWILLCIAFVVLAAGVFLISEPGKRFIGFARDAWREVKKVVWPTRKETMQMTLYVFAFVVVMALFLWFTDKTLEWVLYDLILGWRK